MRINLFHIAASAALIMFTTGAASDNMPNVGPKADISAVTAAQAKYWPNNKRLKDPMRIAGMHDVGDFALFQWYGEESAGFGVYKRTSGENWKRLTYSGGALLESDLANFVGSKSIAHQLCSGWPPHYSPC